MLPNLHTQIPFPYALPYLKAHPETEPESNMYVIKRDGRKEDVKFDKITSRINKLCYGLDSRFVDSVKISQKVWRSFALKNRPKRMWLLDDGTRSVIPPP